MIKWYESDDAPDAGTWWWAVEHLGHPAFYLRALMPGDFQPGVIPLPRHALTLEGRHPKSVRCGTCRKAPVSGDLEVVERATGSRGFLRGFRERGQRWPPPTPVHSCWLCSHRDRPADREVRGPAGPARVCAGCAPVMERS